MSRRGGRRDRSRRRRAAYDRQDCLRTARTEKKTAGPDTSRGGRRAGREENEGRKGKANSRPCQRQAPRLRLAPQRLASLLRAAQRLSHTQEGLHGRGPQAVQQRGNLRTASTNLRACFASALQRCLVEGGDVPVLRPSLRLRRRWSITMRLSVGNRTDHNGRGLQSQPPKPHVRHCSICRPVEGFPFLLAAAVRACTPAEGVAVVVVWGEGGMARSGSCPPYRPTSLIWGPNVRWFHFECAPGRLDRADGGGSADTRCGDWLQSENGRLTQSAVRI